MTMPKEILHLVESFERNLDSYKTQQYNETQLRHEFIDPFFIALGWDVNNDAKNAPAYQLRRYAWSAKLPLSILTDFEEFAVYDCTKRPNINDKPGVARVIFLNYNQYREQWDKIASLFSKDAILKGSFDKYALGTKGKRGTSSVDAEFLDEIDAWREMLAKNIALRNKSLTDRRLNYAVQLTIDRIIFLRMCEDRGIEQYGRLMALVNGRQVYPRLFHIFQHADEKYNSGLFHFTQEKGRPEPPDDLTPNLNIDDKPLTEIIKSLYYPHSPYEFSVLPAEILGNVYEQFLGKVIRLTASHQAKIEEKPEVKKAGGVYYTPAYIVDYIVKNTVGKLCENKTPRQIAKLRILDPACGSGSFLIGAYTYLLNYHRDWYLANDPAKHKKEIYQGKGAQWYLTISEKKKILLNNIFGVDIDSQAVEVTKLSLLLKVLEGETSETLGQTLKLFHERALPDLADNIKCGNSLIGLDFYENQQLDLFDEEEKYKINAFDWQKEFPRIFKQAGFDAVIGNPPYIRVRQIKNDNPLIADYFEKIYKCAIHVWDIYLLFFEKALSLIGKKGFVSFIVPVQTLHQPNCESLMPASKVCSGGGAEL
ncbi:MAG: DNA methyltransferase [Planctomycetota bacterium]